MKISAHDKAHHFTWCFDAAMKEGKLSKQRISEIYNELSHCIPKEMNMPLLGDFAMVLADPHISTLLIRSIMLRLEYITDSYILPR